jgi:hypothetical protein
MKASLSSFASHMQRCRVALVLMRLKVVSSYSYYRFWQESNNSSFDGATHIT